MPRVLTVLGAAGAVVRGCPPVRRAPQVVELDLTVGRQLDHELADDERMGLAASRHAELHHFVPSPADDDAAIRERHERAGWFERPGSSGGVRAARENAGPVDLEPRPTSKPDGSPACGVRRAGAGGPQSAS